MVIPTPVHTVSHLEFTHVGKIDEDLDHLVMILDQLKDLQGALVVQLR